MEFMYPIRNRPSAPSEHQLIAENTALRRTVTQLQVRAAEMEATARRERLAREIAHWVYDREHIDCEDMSDWWPAVWGELTDGLILDLVKQRFAMDADLAAKPRKSFPWPSVPGCHHAYRRRAQEARDAERARQSLKPAECDKPPHGSGHR